MKVKPTQLQNGCITAEDVQNLTDFPIIKENTILNEEHLAILQAFLIKSVDVKPILANGEKFEPFEIIEEEQEQNEKDEAEVKTPEFIYEYLEAVKQYKKLFQSWQAGNPIEMFAVRKIFIPLFERIVQDSNDLLHLHHYSNKEDYLFHHSVYVSILSAYLGKKLQYSKGDWYQIGFSGALADAGMAKLSPTIIKKNGPLTATEYEDVKKHPIHSYKMLKGVTGVTDSVLIAVLQHHERYDGSGYPLGADAQKIHLFSQVVAVADVYHAMTSERYYRAKHSPYRVLEEISKEQFGKFDLKVVEALMQSLIQMSVGSRVRLTSGEEAEIIFFDQQTPTRPMVKLISKGDIIQLKQEPTLHIEEIL
ncbi:HD-GYP domain-containing protein [Halalkalibacter nanhaiisediminis]|uniref:HD-GYP domain-containing protein (C-di-GMP phosphodiesterase class II) n=1 Tax=Halalkalibacter nanhaiisediminis TaxID=688079 RepID=A0A562QTZ8_9BACI|nr:HD-GYP domain-containing protein [Halalkalibacter nanhaiisediminis]TWI59586.1 HD-GYP domain-containing protein (c-di-GMP phosphodiesterase class II) [Halalkalibacter nanhaiisediminis]